MEYQKQIEVSQNVFFKILNLKFIKFSIFNAKQNRIYDNIKNYLYYFYYSVENWNKIFNKFPIYKCLNQIKFENSIFDNKESFLLDKVKIFNPKQRQYDLCNIFIKHFKNNALYNKIIDEYILSSEKVKIKCKKTKNKVGISKNISAESLQKSLPPPKTKQNDLLSKLFAPEHGDKTRHGHRDEKTLKNDKKIKKRKDKCVDISSPVDLSPNVGEYDQIFKSDWHRTRKNTVKIAAQKRIQNCKEIDEDSYSNNSKTNKRFSRGYFVQNLFKNRNRFSLSEFGDDDKSSESNSKQLINKEANLDYLTSSKSEENHNKRDSDFLKEKKINRFSKLPAQIKRDSRCTSSILDIPMDSKCNYRSSALYESKKVI